MELYREVRGSGPVVLLICGGVYDAEGYAPLAEALAEKYTVITYDRRGNSRSALAEPGPQSITVHADDAAGLIDEAAYVFGNSSGAIIGLDLAARFPGKVRALVAHEPPLFEVLEDREYWRGVIDDLEAKAKTEGPFAAGAVLTAAFTAIEGPREVQAPPGAMDPAVMERLGRNMEFFIQFEVPPFARCLPDLEKARQTRVIPAVGAESAPGLPYVLAAHEVGRRMGVETLVLPGDHGGFGGHAKEFAARLSEVFSAASQSR